jgi:hypothetical protein
VLGIGALVLLRDIADHRRARMYVVTHWWGKQEKDLPEERFGDVLTGLAQADREHPDCWLTHESGWTLNYSSGRTLAYENVETGKRGEARRMKDVPPEVVVDLWRHLARGDTDYLDKQAWLHELT